MKEETQADLQPVFADLSSQTLLSLGDSYHVDENYEDAVEAYAAALSLFRESEVLLQIRALSHRSSAFYKLKRYQDALDDAENSLTLLSTKKPEGLRAGEGEICHLRAGLAAFDLNDYQKANNYLQKAEQLSSLNNRDTNKEIYDNMLKKCSDKLSSPAQTSAAAGTSSSVLTKSISDTYQKNDSKDAPTACDVESTILEPNLSEPSIPSAHVATRSNLARTKDEAPNYQYYQSDKVMTISIMEVGVNQQDLTVRFEPNYLLVILRKNGINFTVIAGNLFSEIDVERSKVVFKEEKVLVKLRKVENYEWHELMGKGDETNANENTKKKDISNENREGDSTALPQKIPSVPKDGNVPRPYTSHRDWDLIEKEIIEDEKKEKPEGDEAMNKLFKQIYSNASDDTRRAMVKSFQTSGGTVLSTNWDEVEKKDYEKERTAPKGVEWKTWDGDKVPMKEDN